MAEKRAKKNPGSRSPICPDCGKTLKKIGSRTADPWPDDDGELYQVDSYACKNKDCAHSKNP